MSSASAERPTRVMLVRHGQSTWNAEGRWQGQEDPPLSELGERQAAEAAGRIGPPDAVWASDLARARRTAEMLAAQHGVAVRVHPGLRERHAGPWQGHTRAEIEERWPGDLERGRHPAGWEDDEVLVARVLPVLDAIAGAHPGATVVVVTHGGVVGAIERHLGHRRNGRIPNLGGRVLVADGDAGWRVGEEIVLLDPDSITVPGQL